MVEEETKAGNLRTKGVRAEGICNMYVGDLSAEASRYA